MAKASKGETISLEQIIQDADAATQLEDIQAAQEKLQKLLRDGFVETQSPARAYAPALKMTQTFHNTYMTPSNSAAGSGFSGLFGSLAIDAANALASAERRLAYRAKLLLGFSGLRLVEEGDSWTQYPIFLDDISDQLSAKDDIAIFSLGAAGDLVANMAKKKQYLRALRKSKATAMLLSGGGNDLFGDLEHALFDYSQGADPAALINEAQFSPIFQGVMESYMTILSDVRVQYPDVIVFGHGYDLPFPEEDGKWIGPVLNAKGIPFDVGRKVLRVIMDRFNVALSNLADTQDNFEYCDLRGKVDRGTNSWYNELHPKNAGFARAATIIEERIRSRIGNSAVPNTAALAGFQQSASFGGKTVVLDPGHGGTTALGGSSANNAMGPDGTLEKELTLDVAKRTGDLLTARGFNVLLTRETDVNAGLSARAAVAKSNDADAFVSIHFNASPGHNAQGTETFVHAAHRTGGGGESRSLCRAVQGEMVASLGLNDRNALHPDGIKYGSFGVLNPTEHHTNTAVVLHEVSFLDRADEEARLNTVSYRRKVAMALADGIETYLQLSTGTFHAPEHEMEDGFQIGHADHLLMKGAHQRVVQSVATTANFADVQMSAGQGVTDDFVRVLAASEARFMQRHSHLDGADEGNEPSEFDPAIEAAFNGMSMDVASNIALLQDVFSGVNASGFDHSAFETFIDSLNLRYFSANEFLVQGGQNGSGPCAGKNTLPPQHLWPRMARTAQMIDEIRHRLDAPVHISSAYRSPAYNSCIDGAGQSQHMNFNALDWRCAVGSPSDWVAIAQEVRASSNAFEGYVRAYETFVHIDTRDA